MRLDFENPEESLFDATQYLFSVGPWELEATTHKQQPPLMT
jgi:hypothetical protein